jgi:hypothetical protein
MIQKHIKAVGGIINDTDWKCARCRVKVNKEG